MINSDARTRLQEAAKAGRLGWNDHFTFASDHQPMHHLKGKNGEPLHRSKALNLEQLPEWATVEEFEPGRWFVFIESNYYYQFYTKA